MSVLCNLLVVVVVVVVLFFILGSSEAAASPTWNSTGRIWWRRASSGDFCLEGVTSVPNHSLFIAEKILYLEIFFFFCVPIAVY